MTRFYERFFPAYVTRRLLDDCATRLGTGTSLADGGWLNFWRATDFVADPVFGLLDREPPAGRPPPAVRAALAGTRSRVDRLPDVELDDPLPGEPYHSQPETRRHFGYTADPAVRRALAALADELRALLPVANRLRRADFARLSPLARPAPIPPPDRSWSAQEWATICRGHIAHDPDDRWQAFVERDRLFLHRHPTGHGVYEAQFMSTADGWHISEAMVEADMSFYRRGSDEHESSRLLHLIESVLLARPEADATAPGALAPPPRGTSG